MNVPVSPAHSMLRAEIIIQFGDPYKRLQQPQLIKNNPYFNAERNFKPLSLQLHILFFCLIPASAQTYLQLPLRKWGTGNVYLLVLSSWKVNIAENPIAVMGL